MSKVVFYHHGSHPNKVDAELLKDAGVRVPGRNAEAFKANEIEDVEIVLVDGGDRDAEIRQAYQGKADVIPVADYVAKMREKSGQKVPDGSDKGKFDPDAPAKPVESTTQPPAEKTDKKAK
ncbi:hypothetical protein [Methylopila sp. 73B]|uniref:hypothetical protein n=1 Tax=Methylopila sp. 73B TaxID=1120792 RepID=UPI00035F0257|nr:hypothetical protein [Methylopila sp. 73B]